MPRSVHMRSGVGPQAYLGHLVPMDLVRRSAYESQWRVPGLDRQIRLKRSSQVEQFHGQ